MQIPLLENGMDSLKKGFAFLQQYEAMRFIEGKGTARFFTLKDAILSIHHGVEILFKQVLMNENDILMFSEIDKPLKAAYQEKRQKKLDSIFKTQKTPHTVTLREAIDRMQKICGIEIRERFLDKVDGLDRYRNQLTHSAVYLDEGDVQAVFNGLVDEIDTFFLSTLGDRYKTLSGYSDLKENYRKYLEASDAAKGEFKATVVEKLLEAFEACGISMGHNEARVIDDIQTASQFFSVIGDSELKFGADIYNGYCSGDVGKIRRVGENMVSIFTRDNEAEYRFAFGSLLIFVPALQTDLSPLFFFSAAQTSPSEEQKDFVRKDYYGRHSAPGIYFPEERRFEWDRRKIDEFYYHLDADEYMGVPEYWKVEDFFDEGLLCFINIQGLQFRMANKMLTEFSKGGGERPNLDEIRVALEDAAKRME